MVDLIKTLTRCGLAIVAGMFVAGMIAAPQVHAQGDPSTSSLPELSGPISPPPATSQRSPDQEIDPSEIQGAVDQAKIAEEILGKLPAETQAEARLAVAEFEQLTTKLAAVLLEMRRIQLRFINDENRSKAAVDGYRERRNQASQLMDEAYLAAVHVFRFFPQPAATQYIATMIQHREGQDYYDLSTAEGASLLIDARMASYLFLFQAAARSAVVSGRFDLAERLFEAIGQEQMEDIDRALQADMERLESNYLAEQEIREREAAANDLPRVRLRTTRGDVVLELYLHQAPTTVSNFIRLVEDGFYDGLDFHQVVDHLLALTGDPSGSGTPITGKTIIDEHDRPDARKALRGSLLMAKAPSGQPGDFVPNSASTQFSILFLPMTRVTEQQTVFGRVVEGMSAISSLRRVDPSEEKKDTQLVLPPDRILTAEVIRRPESLPEPVYAEPMMFAAPQGN